MADVSSASPARWSLVVPVKRLELAKTRLVLSEASLRGAPEAWLRGALALAVAVDTVASALSCDLVAAVVVVTGDHRVRAEVESLGAQVVADPPRPGLNAAVRHGAAVVAACCPTARIGALQGDLPALRPQELAAALSRSTRHRSAFVADRAGTGTTLLLAAEPSGLAPRFGAGSASAHLAAGAVRIGDELTTLRLDVDTADDLERAQGLGVGPRTRSVLEQAGARAG